MSSVSILHSDYLHLRLNVIVASTFSIECLWLLVSISVFTVGDFFSNKEIHTFSHICANQSASETFNTSLWRRKTKPASVNYFVIVVLATDKTCGTYPWQVSNFSLLLNIMFWKRLFITMLIRTCFIFQPIFLQFFWYIDWPENPETDIVASSDSVSNLIYRVFWWYTFTYFCYGTAG